EAALAAFGARPREHPRKRNDRARRQRQRPRIDKREDVLAREHKAGARQTDKMGEAADHKRQPECSATTPPVICVTETRRNPASSIILANAFGLGNLRIDS